MKPIGLPSLSAINEFGPADRVFRFLLLGGPLVVLFIVVLGRTFLTTIIAITYIVLLVSYILYRGAITESNL